MSPRTFFLHPLSFFFCETRSKDKREEKRYWREEGGGDLALTFLFLPLRFKGLSEKAGKGKEKEGGKGANETAISNTTTYYIKSNMFPFLAVPISS